MIDIETEITYDFVHASPTMSSELKENDLFRFRSLFHNVKQSGWMSGKQGRT